MPKRNFACPETNEPCTKGDCTKGSCHEQRQLQIARDKEVLARQERKSSARVVEILGPSARRKHVPPR
jgi:hypothetical protein